MQFKIDTKEKFTVLLPQDSIINDNMAEEFAATIYKYLEKPASNIILNLKNVESIQNTIAENIAAIQQKFYEQNTSFVICEINKSIETAFDKLELLDFLNVTPTESEAWDIVQMEEIERELLDNTDEIEFESE
jgi:anti-anti-sigma factor